MKRLVIMRHGKSSWAEFGTSDFDRALKPRGIKDSGIIAEELVKQGILPELIISSPANRAKSTAHLVAQGLTIPLEKIVLDATLYGACLYDVLRIVTSLNDHLATVMLFGHNPTFTDVVNHFGNPMLHLPTCGCVGFDLETEEWRQLNKATIFNSFQIIPSELR